MPSLRFVCAEWFETAIDSPNVPRIGERVPLSEHGLKVNYRVREVTWNFVEGEAQDCLIDVEREPRNPCTKCKQQMLNLLPILDVDYFALTSDVIGWECQNCNFKLHHPNYVPPPPLTAEEIAKLDKLGCGH